MCGGSYANAAREVLSCRTWASNDPCVGKKNPVQRGKKSLCHTQHTNASRRTQRQQNTGPSTRNHRCRSMTRCPLPGCESCSGCGQAEPRLPAAWSPASDGQRQSWLVNARGPAQPWPPLPPPEQSQMSNQHPKAPPALLTPAALALRRQGRRPPAPSPSSCQHSDRHRRRPRCRQSRQSPYRPTRQ